MVKVFQTSSSAGSKGIKSNASRGIKIRQYFDIHLNWYCHQSPGIFQPRLALLHASQICFAGTNTCVPMGWIPERCSQERLTVGISGGLLASPPCWVTCTCSWLHCGAERVPRWPWWVSWVWGGSGSFLLPP